MKRFILILSLLFWHTLSIATVAMNVNPSSAQLGDTLHLTLTLDDAQSRALPDLTPLGRDFTLLGTQHSLSYTVINGTTHSVNQWIILLVAKKAGVLTIPALQIGQQFSEPSQVRITTQDHQKIASESQGVLLSGEVSQNNPFINEQVIYTVKLYSSQRLLEAEYQPPQIKDALLIPLGEGRRYHSTLNDREYAVDEQQYAIFPQKSGELSLSPPTLNALVYDAIPRRIQLKAKPVKLTVKPSTHPHWLPAKQVTLTQRFDVSTSKLPKGDTVVRTITLEAVGVPAQLLPTIDIKSGKQFRVYPEKPTAQNTLRQQELVGTSSMNVTYVLNQAGRITLPPIKLAWFNTKTGQPETATLPERTLTVTTNAATPSPKQTKMVPQPLKQTRQTHPLAWWIAGALAFAWLVTLMLWWIYHRHQRPTGRRDRTLLHDIKMACKINDPIQVQAALLTWATAQWPTRSFLNLNDVIKQVSDDLTLKKQLQLLSHALYSQQNQKTWHGDRLWRSIMSYRPAPSAKKNKDHGLAPINPAKL